MKFKLLVGVIATVLAVSAAGYRSHRHTHVRSGAAGVFDYYVLVLSWSPEFCFSHPNAAQCGKHTGFIVHGLWPQSADGSYPQNCATNQPPPSNPRALEDIMPAEIIEHEWKQHGTCSGLSGDAYFALLRKAYESVKIPPRMAAPSSSFTIRPRELKRAFEQANPQLNDNQMAIQVRGNYLNAVDICESKSETPVPVACLNLRDTRQGSFVVPPVR